MDNKSLLEWYLAAGVDEAIADSPTNYFALQQQIMDSGAKITPLHVASNSNQQKPAAAPLHHSPSEASAASRAIADKCNSLAELEEAVRNFTGCAIKKTASNTVFASGDPRAKIMLIGEAPDAQEDVQGTPFAGPAGALLDKMLAAIGLSREQVYLTNSIFWRPPGNRQPSAEETAICLPFVEKHIALAQPTLLVLCGGTPTTMLLQKDLAISRLRGKWYDYQNVYIKEPVKTALIYHPAYLLRQPAFKKQAWQDLQMMRDFLANPG